MYNIYTSILEAIAEFLCYSQHMGIRLWNCRQSLSSLFSFFGCKREKHPKINAYVARLDRNARRDRYTTVLCRASCHTMERTRNWQRHCRVNNWNHEMDTSVGVIYMNVWYVVACSKSEMRPLNVFSPLRLYHTFWDFIQEHLLLVHIKVIWKILYYKIEEKRLFSHIITFHIFVFYLIYSFHISIILFKW